MATTYIDQMNNLLREKAAAGTRGIRLFVPNSRDINVEDVAHDFCMMEKARKDDKVTRRTSLGF